MSLPTLLLLLAAVGGAMSHGVCGPLQRLKVKAQWGECRGRMANGDLSRALYPERVWDSLFLKYPESRTLFARVDVDDRSSTAFRAHSARVMAAVDRLISVIDLPDVFGPDLEHLLAQHVSRDVTPEYYWAFHQALMSKIPSCVDCFDYMAWDSCLDLIIEGISGQPVLG